MHSKSADTTAKTAKLNILKIYWDLLAYSIHTPKSVFLVI